MRRLFKRFFWGTPSHKGIAWAGALSGLGLLQALEFCSGRPSE